MPRHKGTPLYELMSRRERTSSRPQPRPKPQRPPRAERVSAGGSAAVASLGRIVRMPLGYLLLGVAGVVLTLVVAYMFGASRGEQSARESFDERLLHASGDDWMAEDPLKGGVTPAEASVPAVARDLSVTLPPKRPSVTPERSPQPAARAGSGGEAIGGGADGNRRSRGSGPGPIASDPRQDGQFYYVIAETRPDGAVRLAEFCRENGLEAYVVDGHNPRFRRVIVLPGVATRDLADPSVRRVFAEVTRVGRLWKSLEPGGSDFHDAYLYP